MNTTDKIILGIDPGTLVMGYGIIKISKQKISLLEMGVLQLSKYDDHVLNRNEEFFLSSEFEEYSGGMDVIAKLKQYYKSMNDSSKENVWKYCTNIIRLSKACS